MKKTLIVILLLVCVSYGGCKALVYNHHLSFVPDEFGVWWVEYVAEQSMGFGPSGDAAGIIVYSMPEPLVEKLSTEGLSFLHSLPRDGKYHTDGWRYDQWQETPLKLDQRWKTRKAEMGRPWFSPGIGDFLSGSGLEVQFSLWAEKLTNDAILNPGSFYAYRNGRSIIVLIPSKRRIVVAYSG